MARNKFNMSTIVEIANAEVAAAALAKEKNQKFHHTVILKRMIEVGKATCAELASYVEADKANLLDESSLKAWDKYSNECHLGYFINRCRGAVIATGVDGVQLPQGPTKVRKPKAEKVVEEEAAPVTDESEAALAEAVA